MHPTNNVVANLVIMTAQALAPNSRPTVQRLVALGLLVDAGVPLGPLALEAVGLVQDYFKQPVDKP